MENKLSKEKHMIYIGIDPGELNKPRSGSIASINTRCQYESMSTTTWRLPKLREDFLDLLHVCDERHPHIAYIEKPPIHLNSANEMIRLYQIYERCIMAVMAKDIEVVEITPNKWKNHFELEYCGDKEMWSVMKSKARELFPDIEVGVNTAKSLLIAQYAREVY